MSSQAEKRARAEAMLGELAELSLMLARELAIQARAAEDPEQQVALVAAFQKTSRTLRLTLALDAKLDRDAARAAREAAEDAARRAQAEAQARIVAKGSAPASPIEARKTRARRLLNRLIWTESEGDCDDYEVLIEDLKARLDEAGEAEGFEDIPVEVLARRVAADMGLVGDLRFTATSPGPPGQPSPSPDTG